MSMSFVSLPESHIEDRQKRKNFVTDYAEDNFCVILVKLYQCFDEYNHNFFDNQLVVSHLHLLSPASARIYGQYARVSSFGGLGEISLRLSLLTGTHPDVASGDEYLECRLRLLLDVLLHEMIHQYLDEVLNNPETSFKGHDPKFRGKCNEIGVILGLPPVRAAKQRGTNKLLPSCTPCPHNVRPEGYYLHAYLAGGNKHHPEGSRLLNQASLVNESNCLRESIKELDEFLDSDPVHRMNILSTDVLLSVQQIKRVEEQLCKVRIQLAQAHGACPECGHPLLYLSEACLKCSWGIAPYQQSVSSNCLSFPRF